MFVALFMQQSRFGCIVRDKRTAVLFACKTDSKTNNTTETQVEKPPSDLQTDCSNSVFDASIKKGKNLIKKCRSHQAKKLLNLLRNDKRNPIKDLENLETLVTDAVSTNSRRKIDHEETFYSYLLTTPWSKFIRNRHKISLYFKKPLFHI